MIAPVPVRVRTALAPFVLVFLAALCLLALVAQADDAGVAPAPIAVIDAGPAPAVALDAGLDASSPAADKLPDPASDPSAAWQAVQAGRKTGGLWLAVAMLVAMAAKAYRVRALPKPGEAEPSPLSWRAKSIAISAAALAIASALIDKAAGVGTWGTVATVAIAAVLMVWSSFDPPKGSKLAKAATPG